MINFEYQKDKPIEKFKNQLSNELFKNISGNNLCVDLCVELSIPSQNRFLEEINLNISGIIYKRINKL